MATVKIEKEEQGAEMNPGALFTMHTQVYILLLEAVSNPTPGHKGVTNIRRAVICEYNRKMVRFEMKMNII